MTIIDLLFQIEQQRELYIGDGDLFALQHFVAGYCICQQLNDLEWEDQLLHHFDVFVRKHYSETRTISSYRCIVTHTNTKEEAFLQFFHLLHQYALSIKK